MEKQNLLTQKIIWFALLSSTFVYASVAFINVQNADGIKSESPLRWILIGMAAVSAIASFLLPKNIEKPMSSFTNLQGFLGQIFTLNIIRWALSEAVIIYGLVLAFTEKDLTAFYPLWGLTVVLFMIHRPQEIMIMKKINDFKNQAD